MPEPRTDPRLNPLSPSGPPAPATGSVRVAAESAADTPAAGSKPLGLSITQIAGGALAAVTAAVAASFLGVAGTLIGAALASVVSSVAAALYSTSLHRAATVSKVLVVRPAGSATGPLEASAEDPAAVPPAVRREPLAGPISAHWWNKLRWGPVAAVAGLLFVAAMVVVNLSELAIGHPLGNSASSGTTLTNLGGGTGPAASPSGSTSASPTATPSPTGSDAGATPTPSASANPLGASPTSSPAASPTATPSSSPTTGTGATTSTGTGTTAPSPPAPPPSPGG